MSLDLYQPEIQERLAAMPLTTRPEPSIWDGFMRGAGLSSMRGLARVGRSIDLLGSVGPIAMDAITGGTEAQDRYFREHDDVWGSAVDYWTPRPGEVGIAGQVVGNLASMLPMVIASPGLAVADAYIGTAEDLVREGVKARKAQQVGAVQAVGLGTGIWMPILGQNLWQRVLLGGAGFNVAQGVATRAASSEILKGTAAASAFEPFDAEQLTLDVLLGLAFGTMAHLSPEMRAQGAETWKRIAAWAENLSPGDKAAIAALRQAQHAAVDTFPGETPASPADVAKHADRLQTALEQILREEPVNVENLPEPEATGNAVPRMQEAEARTAELQAHAEVARAEEGLAAPPEAAPEPPTREAAAARDVAQDIRQRLETAGMAADEATANSTLWEAFFRTTAKRMGMTPEELYARYPVDITTAAPAGADVLGQRGTSGYAGSREPGQTAQAPQDPENLPATVGGGRPAPGWSRATRASRAGRPIPLFRGAAGALEPGHFDPQSLGTASGNPSAGLGVWFTPDRTEAGTYGPHVDEVYVDVRNPKVVKIEDLPGFDSVADATAWREQLRAQGHDSVVITAKHLKGKSHLVVFDPSQVIPAKPPEAGVLFQSQRGARFYSELERQIGNASMNQAPAKGWKEWLKSLGQKGVKADEIKWSGIEDWLDLQEGRVTKQQVLDFIKHNGVKVDEVMLGGKGVRTLADPQIRADVDFLTANGFTPELDPMDQGRVAFNDAQGGDIVTAGEIRSYNEDATPEERMTFAPIIRAAERVEVYYHHGPRAPLWTEMRGDAEAAVEDLGWQPRWSPHGILTLDRIGSDGVTVEETVRMGDDAEYLAAIPPDQPGHIPGFTPEVVQAARELERYGDPSGRDIPPDDNVRTPKFATYTLPGGKEYRELLLTLPPPMNEDGLPRGFRIEEMETPKTNPRLNQLSREFRDWMNERADDRGIPDGDANEMLMALSELPPYRGQQNDLYYLRGFVRAWDQATAEFKEEKSRRWTLITPDGSGRRMYATQNRAEAVAEAKDFIESTGALEKSQFTAGHWDEPNVLAHVRFNERADAEGKKVLFIEEIQSDWAQKGKRHGFRDEKAALDAEWAFEKARSAAYALVSQARETVGKYIDPRGASATDRALNDIVEMQNEGKNWQLEYGITSPEDVKSIGDYVNAQIEQDTREAVRDALLNSAVPAAPFVGKTDAWVALTLKRMIAYAVENGFDRVAWTSGEQQTERWSGGLRKAVDVIEWTKTDKGVQIVGYKGKPLSAEKQNVIEALRERITQYDFDLNQILDEAGGLTSPRDITDPALRARYDETMAERRTAASMLARSQANQRTKVVDTTEREDVLSDAIGKTMAQRIMQDPNQHGTIEGDDIVVADTGMAEFYDRIVPKVAKELLKKLGGGKVGETTVTIRETETGTTLATADFDATGAEVPNLKPMADSVMEAFAGADNFDDGSPPLYAEGTIRINDHPVDVAIVAEGNGLHVISNDAQYQFELMLTTGINDFTPAKAITAVQKMWSAGLAGWEHTDPTTDFVRRNMTLINGELPGGAPKGSKQMSFDITPEMRAKVTQGLQLFQTTEGTARGYLRQAAQPGERATIGILQSADRSTFLHESGHFFLDVTNDLARSPEAPAALQRDMQTLYDWLGVDGGADAWNAMSLEEKRPYHEKFARGFEAYLREGEAPAPQLKTVFQLFRDWLIQIYRSAQDLNVTVSREVKDVIDRMLAEPKAEGTAARPVAAEPPPPRGTRAAEAAVPEAADPWRLSLDEELKRREASAQTYKQLTLQDEPARAELQHMADMETGWEVIGGRLDRGRMAREQGVGPENVKMGTPAFTPWIPKAEWWPGRPGPSKLGEKAVQEAVRKALAGEPLKKGEQRTIDYMLEVASRRVAAMEEVGGPEEWAGILTDIRDTGLEPTTDNVVDSNLVARAAAIDETRVENAAIRYENDDTAFMAEIKAILDEADQNNQAARGRAADSSTAQAAEAAGERAAEAADPLAAAAERFVAEQPSRLLQVGTNADGTPQYLSAQEFLEQARADAAQAREDMKLFEVAAQCMLTGGRS